VLFACAIIALQIPLVGFSIGAKRKKYFNKAFFEKNFPELKGKYPEVSVKTEALWQLALTWMLADELILTLRHFSSFLYDREAIRMSALASSLRNWILISGWVRKRCSTCRYDGECTTWSSFILHPLSLSPQISTTPSALT
jgi:hypothetical protein